MGNFSFIQLIILLLLFTLVFGDLPKIVNSVKTTIKNFTKSRNKNRKKGN